MATLFSDQFGASQANSTWDSGFRPDSNISGGRLRYKRVSILIPVGGTGGTSADIWRLTTFKSSDRITNMFMSASATGGNGTTDVGVYLAGTLHDGAVVDVDLFATAVALNPALVRTDKFTESGNLVSTNRGKPLWFLADLGSGTYSTDPKIQFDICATLTQTTTVGTSEVVFEFYYTAGA